MSKISSVTVGTARNDFHPNLQTLDVKYMITLSWKSFYSLILFKVFQADITSSESKISISFKKNHCCDLPEVLIVIAHDLLKLLIVLVLRI